MTKTISLSLIGMAVLGFLMAGCSSESPDANTDTNTQPMNNTYTTESYTALLERFVDDQGRVDYEGLQADRADLDAYVASYATISTDTYNSWTAERQMALWINAYNAITLKAIIDHYPIQKGGLINSIRYPANSIRQIDGVWKKHTTRVAGRTVTLDAIEHDILREEFDEPRIHVAIVCASVSCPPLRAEAFTADQLDSQLADQSRRFFADPISFRVDTGNKRVYLSAILDWFDDDFVGHYNTQATISGHNERVNAILDYVRSYTDDRQADYLKKGGYKVSFIDYDWTLNEQP